MHIKGSSAQVLNQYRNIRCVHATRKQQTWKQVQQHIRHQDSQQEIWIGEKNRKIFGKLSDRHRLCVKDRDLPGKEYLV